MRYKRFKKLAKAEAAFLREQFKENENIISALATAFKSFLLSDKVTYNYNEILDEMENRD